MQLDTLAIVEGPRGVLTIDLVRAGRGQTERLAPAAWSFKGRPGAASADLLAWVAGFAAKESKITALEVERRLASEPAESASWAWARFAEAAGRRSDWNGAVEAYAAAIALTPAPDSADLERVHGEALRRLNRYDDAEAAYRRSLALWNRAEPSGLGASAALGALGSLAGARYDLAEAKRLHSEAEKIRKRLAPGSWLHASTLNNLGIIAGRRNDLAAAEEYLLAAVALAEKGQGDQAPLLANLGIVARLRGDLERAEMYTRRSIERFRAAGNSREVASKLMTLGNILGDGGRLDEGLAANTEVVALLDGPSPDRELLGVARSNRALLLQKKGEHGAAARELAAARALFGLGLPRTASEAQVTALEAAEAERRGDLSEAARLAEITLEARARLQPDSSFEAQAASDLARLRDLQGRPVEAEALHGRAIEKLERQQSRLGGGDRGLVAFRGKFAGIYRAYQEFLLKRGRIGEAFETFERARARALLALLQQRDLDVAAAGLDPQLVRRRNELGAEIDRAYLALAGLPSDAAADAARDRQRLALEALHAERERLSQAARSASPRLAAIETPPAATLAEVERALEDGTLLLAYSLGPTSSTLFALSAAGGLAAHPIAAGEEELATDVARWVELTSGGALGRAELRTIEERLSMRLLGPVAARLAAAKRLLVIPDGPLHALAFAALPDPRAPARRLVEALAVSHQLSASVHAELERRAGTGRGAGVAVFADPVTAEATTASARRSFGRLPATRREAEKVREARGASARLFVDRSATEAAARRELSAAALTHFATHGLFDEALPLDSALLLSPEAGSDEVGEGLLQAWEIAEQVDVASDLVVLSACETARGVARGGEGIVGLVRTLQVAGARSVVASLWRIEDESASEFMARFHAGLAAGKRRDVALREAQLALLRGPVRVERAGKSVQLRTSDPRYWAPYVLLGPAR